MRSNYQYTYLLRKRLERLPLLLICGFAALSASFAQDDEEEEIFELSPFTVQAEEGWVATETLAGSRLRTDFKDVASQVEVMTMEFMDDFAVNSVEEALIYSVNVSGPEDYVSGNGEGFGNSQISNFNQIRGVLGGTLSRNFFPIDMPTDNYNVSRVTIASGPNSILFGTGSPAGVLDVTLNRASTTGDFGKIKFEWDSWDGKRYVFDYNKAIGEKLAFRFAFVDDNAQQDINPNHDRSTRWYGTFLMYPTKNTTISLHAEKTKRDENRVNRFLPYDKASPWFNSGQPVFENPGGGWNSPFLGQVFSRVSDTPRMVWDGTTLGGTQVFRNTVQIVGPETLPGVWNLNNEADGWTFIDGSIFSDDINTFGAASKHFIEDTQYNIFLEQKILENLFFELAYNTEDWNEHSYGNGTNRNIRVDPNRYLNDGVTPNPHFGEFYMESNAQWQRNSNNRENWRATMSYEFNFAERTDGWVSNLGRHRLAALRSHDRFKNLGQQGMRYRWLPDVNGNDPSFAGSGFNDPNRNNNWATDGSRQFWVRHYLNESNGFFASEIDGLLLDGTPIQLQDGTGQTFTLAGLENPYYDVNGHQLISNNGAQGISTKQDTVQFAYQGYFWNDRVVLTYGWRQDKASSQTFDGDLNVRNSGRDSNGDWRTVHDADGNLLPFARPTGLWPYYLDLPFGEFGVAQKGITRTAGIVVHASENLSFHYNESDTFQPNIGRFDPYGNEYPGAEGDGEDYGFALTVLDGKLTLRYNEFETLGGPQRAANTPFNRWRDRLWDIEDRWRNLVANPTWPAQGEGGFREKGRANYWVMSDKFSEGTEITIAANPIKNLNMRFTWTDREAIESDIGKVWDEYMNERLPVWQSLNVPEGGENSPEDLDGDGVIGTWTWDTAWYNSTDPANGGQTLSQRYIENTIGGSIGWALIQSLDGKANEFDRSSRWNFNTSYRFTEGRLKGVTLGGALRWRDAPVIGYGITGDASDPASVISLSDLQIGAEDFTTDLVASYRGKADLFGERDYKVQLNIRNAFDKDENVPGIKDINGNNIRMIRKSQRQFILSFELDI